MSETLVTADFEIAGIGKQYIEQQDTKATKGDQMPMTDCPELYKDYAIKGRL